MPRTCNRKVQREVDFLQLCVVAVQGRKFVCGIRLSSSSERYQQVEGRRVVYQSRNNAELARTHAENRGGKSEAFYVSSADLSANASYRQFYSRHRNTADKDVAASFHE